MYLTFCDRETHVLRDDFRLYSKLNITQHSSIQNSLVTFIKKFKEVVMCV